MGFAGKDDLDGAPAVLEMFFKTLQILEDQQGSFVGGKPAGKAERQNRGVQKSAPGKHDGGADISIGPALAGALPDCIDQFHLEPVVRLPQALSGRLSRSCQMTGSS